MRTLFSSDLYVVAELVGSYLAACSTPPSSCGACVHGSRYLEDIPDDSMKEVCVVMDTHKDKTVFASVFHGEMEEAREQCSRIPMPL